ncbi:beta-ketoacyl synthase N-terminal-like domain-containing protein [Spirosoma sordidisoli]|uniref:Beta-ketoacyl synthase-like N-terminal domain-containing protein n=1 Tax=Spirosoma sordidisoli TaxID=2502893 RepID=A0A4Q2ULR6_9BACT|nr:beta-ketoacyl synthase N-terminal-like domain-containing protein [Spirosoma sordidisoli]RYC68460.1 hypothetical protein EQG79_19060 [Spirosoma sordidisoli]
MKPVYIESVAGVPAQWTPTPTAALFRAVEPAYQQFISPGESRRWSKACRMGVYSAMQALRQASVTDGLGAVTVGTGVGGLDCSERFQRAIVEQQESGLSPTLFLQSLHSSISGQIALSLQCKGYNMTYTHRGTAFESALLDAALLLDEDPELGRVLVGGVDEVAPVYLESLRRAGYLQQPDADFADGIVPGEGATFFVVSPTATPDSLAVVRDLRLVHSVADETALAQAVNALLADHGLVVADLDLVLSGLCGQPVWDRKLAAWIGQLPASVPSLPFKTWCGESHTATAFATGLAVRFLNGTYPEETGTWPHPTPPKTILIVNHYQDANYGIVLLTAADC